MEHILEFLSTGGETREVLKERLQEIPKELDAVCATFEGRFVPPGGSGCPSPGRQGGTADRKEFLRTSSGTDSGACRVGDRGKDGGGTARSNAQRLRKMAGERDNGRVFRWRR